MSFENTSTDTTPSTDDTSGTTVATENVTPQANDIEAASAPEFTPNYKYKAYGKELEVEEWAKPLISKDTQEHFIKLHERAGGFDHLKNNFKELEQKHSVIENNFNQLNQVRHAIVSNISKGNLDQAFQLMDLKDEQIFNYVKQKLEYQQLPPDQKQIVDAYRANLERTEQSQNLALQQKAFAEDIMMQKHELEVMTTFNNPKYASTITDYNTRAGDENAFKNVMTSIGANEFYKTGRHMPVAEATEAAIKMLMLNPVQAQAIQDQANHGSQIPGNAPSTSQSVKATPQPIMRVGKSGGQAPIQQRPKSIDDIKKLYQQEYGA